MTSETGAIYREKYTTIASLGASFSRLVFEVAQKSNTWYQELNVEDTDKLIEEFENPKYSPALAILLTNTTLAMSLFRQIMSKVDETKHLFKVMGVYKDYTNGIVSLRSVAVWNSYINLSIFVSFEWCCYNLTGHKVNIAYIENEAPYTTLSKDDNGWKFGGLVGASVSIVINNLGLKFGNLYPQLDMKYGDYIEETNVSTGMFTKLLTKEADMVIAGLSLTSGRRKIADFSYPIFQQCISDYNDDEYTAIWKKIKIDIDDHTVSNPKDLMQRLNTGQYAYISGKAFLHRIQSLDHSLKLIDAEYDCSGIYIAFQKNSPLTGIFRKSCKVMTKLELAANFGRHLDLWGLLVCYSTHISGPILKNPACYERCPGALPMGLDYDTHDTHYDTHYNTHGVIETMLMKIKEGGIIQKLQHSSRSEQGLNVDPKEIEEMPILLQEIAVALIILTCAIFLSILIVFVEKFWYLRK
ncbi:hypothetical protein GQR58_006224 [Nymphon striatum]|nr:hypothetical protein GQR58_006224 [Nymphon striatum]